MKNTLKLLLVAPLLMAASSRAEDLIPNAETNTTDKGAVELERCNVSKLLESVRTQIKADKFKAGEIVSAAIISSDADKNLVAQIVETAIIEAPSERRFIYVCAIAWAPDASTNIHAVLERYDTSAGDDYSSKGGLADPKSVLDFPEKVPNPLDDPFPRRIFWTPLRPWPPIATPPTVTPLNR